MRGLHPDAPDPEHRGGSLGGRPEGDRGEAEGEGGPKADQKAEEEVKMKLKFYCGCNGKWTGFFSESDECEASGIIEVEKEEWDEGFINISCPECGAELDQSMDHFELLKGDENET